MHTLRINARSEEQKTAHAIMQHQKPPQPITKNARSHACHTPQSYSLFCSFCNPALSALRYGRKLKPKAKFESRRHVFFRFTRSGEIRRSHQGFPRMECVKMSRPHPEWVERHLPAARPIARPPAPRLRWRLLSLHFLSAIRRLYGALNPIHPVLSQSLRRHVAQVPLRMSKATMLATSYDAVKTQCRAWYRIYGIKGREFMVSEASKAKLTPTDSPDVRPGRDP